VKLGEISIDGATEDQRRIFYTALYHSMLYPRTFSEHGRYYSAFDDHIHNGESYTDYSMWDIFRAEFSLLTLVAPERIGGMTQALLQDYQEGGWMPKWPNPSYTNIMIATHADSLVAEAASKGFTGFSPRLAWDAVYKDAMTPPTATPRAHGATANRTRHTRPEQGSPTSKPSATSPPIKHPKPPRAPSKMPTTTGASPRSRSKLVTPTDRGPAPPPAGPKAAPGSTPGMA
jgi:Glycosyl hydrolase family 92